MRALGSYLRTDPCGAARIYREHPSLLAGFMTAVARSDLYDDHDIAGLARRFAFNVGIPNEVAQDVIAQWLNKSTDQQTRTSPGVATLSPSPTINHEGDTSLAPSPQQPRGDRDDGLQARAQSLRRIPS